MTKVSPCVGHAVADGSGTVSLPVMIQPVPPKPTRVWVYGTLKNGYGNHGLLRGSIFVGEAVSPNIFKIKCVSPSGGFPIIMHGYDAVLGEVYDVDDATLRALDRLEGTPHMYQRKMMTLDKFGVVSYYHWRETSNNQGYDNEYCILNRDGYKIWVG